MAAFGLGTLPWLLAAGVAAARLRGWIQRRPVRAATGSLVAAYGAWGLAHSLIIGGHT
jgi:sulfite exporter TauE/SafE